MKDTKAKLSHITISLHWLVGLTIIALIGVGMYMESNSVYSLYPIHKSIGILILLFVIPRVIWRLYNGWPQPASDYQVWEHRLAHLIHWVLIIGTVLFPISGMMMSGAGGHGLEVFGIELLSANVVDGKAVPLNADVAGLGHTMHGVLGNVMIGAIVLHVAGALKHHIMDKDHTLKRMLGKKAQ